MKLRLKDIREDRDIKQIDVANYLNCTQVCYSRYENGQRDIPLNTLCLLAKYFNTTTDYILGLTDNPNKM
ncbi:MAG: helix-turn-helix domain-containing protein [Eubacterium sp.]|jgi:transcriptional regulator with XRE-family HTH domain|nr:helix-turn-helix domain-containing protein [Eubacterium sp.]MDE6506644.1 helix-turn-helix domain-containing protein [Eubacterium sp.]